MSREIKFRAWDRINKIMTYNPINVINFEGQILLNDGKFYDIDKTDYILMQYTGLKDKNGKKIFEGDLVQKIHKGKAYQVCEVKFNDGTFVVDDFDANGCKFFWSLRGMQHCWKVIGNVYENPELIGGGNG